MPKNWKIQNPKESIQEAVCFHNASFFREGSLLNGFSVGNVLVLLEVQSQLQYSVLLCNDKALHTHISFFSSGKAGV